MLGKLYLFLCLYLGGVLVELFLPSLTKNLDRTFDGRKLKTPIPSFLVLLPACFSVGAVVSGWGTYLLGYLFRADAEPLKKANAIWMIGCTLFCFLMSLYLHNRKEKRRVKAIEEATIAKRMESDIVTEHDTNAENDGALTSPVDKTKGMSVPEELNTAEDKTDGRTTAQIILSDVLRTFLDFLKPVDLIYFFLVTLLVCALMIATCHMKDGILKVGFTVYSDFAPHLAMIRSFSFSNNFPTVYSHFGGQDIRYHFLFQFLAGNLEYLGLRIDHAFNSISIISLIGEYLLLYVLAVKLTGSRFAAFLSGIFMSLRSSFAIFEFLATLPKGANIIQTLRDHMDYVGFTEHEDWGLWNLNVYVNQRHLAIGICLLLIAVLALSDRLFSSDGPKSVLKKVGWFGGNLKEAILLGIILGLGSFFNGACVIAALLVLFVIALFSDHRLDFLIVAVITVVLTKLESMLFMTESPMSFEYWYGFLAENKTFFGALVYVIRMMGVLPFVLAAAFVMQKWKHRVMIAAFSLPIVFAFTVKMSVEITANHKYIFIAMALLSVYSAYVIEKIVKSKDVIRISAGVVLSVFLTATGVYDLYQVFHKNSDKKGYVVVYDMDDPMIEWVHENATYQDLFLSYWHTTNAVTLGGGCMYLGWPYFAWSAGYDTYYRRDQMIFMYGAETPEELMELTARNNIRFILVDPNIRADEEVTVNEENIKNTFTCVYNHPYYNAQIYDTSKPLVK